ncbi:hypothetical protein [Kaistella sp.]|uniref:hypothetical protein n=1 Tax=Kaistella sp. TaxID=2782235 RepID=UPI0035A0A02F
MEIPTYYSPQQFRKEYQIDYMLFADQMSLSTFLHQCKKKTGANIFFDVFQGDILRELDSEHEELLGNINATQDAIALVLQEMFDKKMLSTELIQNNDESEHDFSDTKPLETMIILEKLGIIKHIQDLQHDPMNDKQTAVILSAFTGIPATTIAKNLGVMVREKKNDSDKNSPYKNPKNLQLANKKLGNFNIDLSKII